MASVLMLAEQTAVEWWTIAGGAVVIATALVGCTTWIVQRLGAVEAEVKALRDLQSDQYTRTMATEHALRMALNNPGLLIPDPLNPSKILGKRES